MRELEEGVLIEGSVGSRSLEGKVNDFSTNYIQSYKRLIAETLKERSQP